MMVVLVYNTIYRVNKLQLLKVTVTCHKTAYIAHIDYNCYAVCFTP